MERADHVLCISEQTQRDLVRIFEIDPSKTSVTYLGVGQLKINSNVKENISSKPYILYVGNRGGYKNFEGLLRAFVSSHHLRANFRIVCFGGERFTDAEFRQIITLGVPRQCIEHRRGGDDKLAVAYQGASVFVYPSCTKVLEFRH